MRMEIHLRVARPTDRLDDVVRFDTEGLGLASLGAFAHRAPSADNLLVFHLPDEREWREAVGRMIGSGYEPVPSFNPYWDQVGRTFEDPDGYRVVLQHAAWSA